MAVKYGNDGFSHIEAKVMVVLKHLSFRLDGAQKTIRRSPVNASRYKISCHEFERERRARERERLDEDGEWWAKVLLPLKYAKQQNRLRLGVLSN